MKVSMNNDTLNIQITVEDVRDRVIALDLEDHFTEGSQYVEVVEAMFRRGDDFMWARRDYNRFIDTHVLQYLSLINNMNSKDEFEWSQEMSEYVKMKK